MLSSLPSSNPAACHEGCYERLRQMGKIISDGTVSIYEGANTASGYYGSWLAVYAVISTIGSAAFVVDLPLERMYQALELFLVAFTISLLVRYIHYRRVVLTNVQCVLPKVTESRDWRIPLRFEVTVDGTTQEVQTEAYFGYMGLCLADYVDKPRVAGLDEERQCWVII